MSEASSNSNYSHMSIVQNSATAHEDCPNSGATPDGASTSAMVQVGAEPADASEPSDVTPDHTETNDDVAHGADFVDVMNLSPKMHQVIELLFAGHSLSAVAREVGVHRNTIARWLNNHAAFIAAYNRRRSETADDLSRRITGLLDSALTAVERHLTTRKQPTPEQIKASLRLISTLGRSRRVFAVGPTDPFAVLDQMIRRDRYLCDRTVHNFIDDKTRASYITTYTRRLTDQAPESELPFAPDKRIPKGSPREQPIHPWDEERKRSERAKQRRAS